MDPKEVDIKEFRGWADRLAALACGLALIAAGGCAAPPPAHHLAGATAPATPAGVPADLDPAPAELKAFRDCAEFVAHMRSAARARIDSDGLHLNEGQDLVELTSDTAGAVFGPAAGSGGGEPLAPSATSSMSGPSFPTPPGGDLVASDGRVLVTARIGRLQVVDVSTGTPRLLAHLDLDGMAGRSQFVVLAGTRVLVVSPADDPRVARIGPAGYKWPAPVRRTTMSVVDLSDPAHPRVVGSQSVTGRFVAVRGTGELARVVIVTDPEDRPAGAYRGDPADARAAVAHASAADWLPDRQTRDGKGRVTARGPLLDCTAILRPPTDSGLDTVSVLTVDLAGERPFDAIDATGILGSGDLVAASAERLVVATIAGWVDQNRRSNRKLEPAHPRTLLHAFDLTVRGAPRYVASGGLARYVAGQGALSVRGTDVRVVTSTFPPWLAPRNSTKRQEDAGVAVLVERVGALRVAGTVVKLADGRPLKMIRWTDDLVALAPMPERTPRFYANADAGRMDLVHLPTAASPRLLGHLTLPTPTASLFAAGGGFLVGTGLRAGFDRDVSVEAAAVDLGTAGEPRRTDALSYGQGEIFAGGATWLAGRRVLVLTGSLFAGTNCPPGIRCVNSTLPADTGAVLLRVDADGDLRPAGRLEQHVQGTPLDFLDLGDRLAAVGDRLTLLDARTLRPTGAVELPFSG